MRLWIRIVVIVVAISATPAAAQVTDEPAQNEPQSEAKQSEAKQDEPKQEEPKKDQAPPPPHGSTGWASLVKDSAGDFMAFPRRHSTWVILGIGAGAALATHPADHYVETHIVGNDTANRVFSLGQWVGSTYVQVGSAVGLWVVGRYIVAPADDQPRTNKYSELGFDLIRAQILSQSIVHGMKYTIRRDRPTGECCAFPSGHAASAFAAASVLERHFGYRASWPALAAATYVATSRLVDNRHFMSDVAFGAALGMSSGWTVVGTRGRTHHLALDPVPVRGGMMIAFHRVDD